MADRADLIREANRETKIKPLLQRHSHSCGATCIAMIAGVSLDAAEQACGIRRMPTRKLLAGLNAHDIETSGRFKPISRQGRPLAAPGDIVRIRWLTGGYHYVVTAGGGAFFCPGQGRVTTFEHQARMLSVLRCRRHA